MHSHMGCHLVVLLLLVLVSRHVGAAVLAVVDTLASPFLLLGQVGDYLHGDTYAQEVHKTDILVSDNLDLINVTVPRQVVAQLLLGQAIVQVAQAVQDVSETVSINDKEGLLDIASSAEVCHRL